MSRLGIVNRRYTYIPGDYCDLMIRRDPERATDVEAHLQTLAKEIDPDVVLWTRSLDQLIMTSHGFLAIAPMIATIGGMIGVLSLCLASSGYSG
jgi:hypothetical protein